MTYEEIQAERNRDYECLGRFLGLADVAATMLQESQVERKENRMTFCWQTRSALPTSDNARLQVLCETSSGNRNSLIYPATKPPVAGFLSCSPKVEAHDTTNSPQNPLPHHPLLRSRFGEAGVRPPTGRSIQRRTDGQVPSLPTLRGSASPGESSAVRAPGSQWTPHSHRLRAGLPNSLKEDAMLNWKVTKQDRKLIAAISQRATAMAISAGCSYSVQDVNMDITATHANGCKLKLAELASAPDFDFAHDVFGIRRHLNRATGHLEDCFLPRYAI